MKRRAIFEALQLKRAIMGILTFVLLAASLSVLQPSEASAAESAKISAQSFGLNPGAVRTLAVSGVSGTVTWSVSNAKVVSIKKNGNKATITAKKKGNATITARAGGAKLQCKVKVSGKKILTAYFSRTGNSRKIAEYIQKSIGGDLVQIKTKTPYPSDYDKCVSQAEKELDDDIRPEISTQIRNFAQYDEVVIGYPIWWGMAPRAVCTFAESYDWKGKNLILYCTSNSSGLGDSASELERLCEGANRTKAFSAYEDDILSSGLKKKIDKWLKNIGA